MANPRAYVAFNGVDAEQVSVKYDSSIVYDNTQPGGSAAAGKAVRLTGNAQVGLTIDASPVDGKLIDVKADGFCTVQFDGFCALPAGNAAVVTAGKKAVGALGPAAAPGYIRDAASAAEQSVTGAETWDATDTTAVAVNLG